MHRTMRRWLPLLVLIGLFAVALGMGWHRHLSWAGLAGNQAFWAGYVAAYPWLAPVAFVAAYILAVLASLPGLAVLSVTGGLLFGIALGSFLVVLGATTGAVLVFLAARTALAEPLARRFGALAARLRPELESHGFTALLALRLVAVVPFVLPNLAAAMVGMRLGPFTAATAIGIVPATLVFTAFGTGLAEILASGQQPDIASILTPTILLPFLGMAGLALLPVLWRLWRRRKAAL